MVQVVWSDRALNDLKTIRDYIALDSFAQAQKVVKEITGKTRNLERFPSMGRFVPELAGTQVREIQSYSYRILYHAAQEQVNVLAIVHGKQNMNSVFYQK